MQKQSNLCVANSCIANPMINTSYSLSLVQIYIHRLKLFQFCSEFTIFSDIVDKYMRVFSQSYITNVQCFEIEQRKNRSMFEQGGLPHIQSKLYFLFSVHLPEVVQTIFNGVPIGYFQFLKTRPLYLTQLLYAILVKIAQNMKLLYIVQWAFNKHFYLLTRVFKRIPIKNCYKMYLTLSDRRRQTVSAYITTKAQFLYESLGTREERHDTSEYIFFLMSDSLTLAIQNKDNAEFTYFLWSDTHFKFRHIFLKFTQAFHSQYLVLLNIWQQYQQFDRRVFIGSFSLGYFFVECYLICICLLQDYNEIYHCRGTFGYCIIEEDKRSYKQK